jgi:hypothetical protein
MMMMIIIIIFHQHFIVAIRRIYLKILKERCEEEMSFVDIYKKKAIRGNQTS